MTRPPPSARQARRFRVYLSEGIPAIQLGQEFLRTKGGNDNSYNAGDEVNAIDWDRTTQYSGSVTTSGA